MLTNLQIAEHRWIDQIKKIKCFSAPVTQSCSLSIDFSSLPYLPPITLPQPEPQEIDISLSTFLISHVLHLLISFSLSLHQAPISSHNITPPHLSWFQHCLQKQLPKHFIQHLKCKNNNFECSTLYIQYILLLLYLHLSSLAPFLFLLSVVMDDHVVVVSGSLPLSMSLHSSLSPSFPLSISVAMIWQSLSHSLFRSVSICCLGLSFSRSVCLPPC